MLLAIDAGNTNVTFGVFDGSEHKVNWRIGTQPGRTADEYAALLHNLFIHQNLAFEDIDAVIAASVVPSSAADLRRLSLNTFHAEPLFVTADLDMGITVAYNPPADVGADRLVDAVAALHKYGPAPMIVIDFGTATTFNAIAAGNIYLGGALLPGISLSWDTLFARAARLSSVSRVVPPAAIGDTTMHALQSGMTFGLAAMVDGMVARFRAELSAPDCPVIATGGQAADLLASVSTSVTHVDPLLTLDGLRLVWERNRH